MRLVTKGHKPILSDPSKYYRWSYLGFKTTRTYIRIYLYTKLCIKEVYGDDVFKEISNRIGSHNISTNKVQIIKTNWGKNRLHSLNRQ